MSKSLKEQQEEYANIIVQIGLNLQAGQSLRLSAELAHAELTRLVVDAAYRAGARYVHVEWGDDPTTRSRLVHGQPDDVEYVPDYEEARFQQMADEQWCRLALVGSEFPNLFDDADPVLMRKYKMARSKSVKPYMQVMMSNQVQWCVAAVPTVAWARQIFPAMDEASDGDVTDELWRVILEMCRTTLPDPVEAWRQHDQKLAKVVQFMAQNAVRSVRFLDSELGTDGKPKTDLTVGLSDDPVWLAASAQTTAGISFFPNMPTEEVFTTPHNQRTSGWVRTSKPIFPMERRVDDAIFRFEDGELTDFGAESGVEALEQYFEIPGTRRLGEVALVDVRSPVNQSGLIFYNTLFDENAVCHVAFGQAYPEGINGGNQMSPEELKAAGANESDAHEDFMIGSSSMDVIGICADGSEVVIMKEGQFAAEVLR